MNHTYVPSDYAPTRAHLSVLSYVRIYTPPLCVIVDVSTTASRESDESELLIGERPSFRRGKGGLSVSPLELFLVHKKELCFPGKEG